MAAGKDISGKRGSFHFGPGLDYHGDHFRILSSHAAARGDYDVLLFADSRGSAVEKPGEPSWVDLLLRDLEGRGMSFLAVTRPKDLTVFFTLLNFLALNPVRFGTLVTNWRTLL